MNTYQHSIDAYTEAVDLMPGGFNSPVRAAFKSIGLLLYLWNPERDLK